MDPAIRASTARATTPLIGPGAAIFVAGVIAIALADESQTVDQAASDVIAEARHEAHQMLPDSDFDQFENALRAGTDEELRQKYGRVAKSKLGLTLEGDVPPEIRARQSHE